MSTNTRVMDMSTASDWSFWCVSWTTSPPID